MKTRMLRWLARVALSLVAIAAWGTGATAQSLSGVYGGEGCDFKLTFRPKDVVYIQFLAGGTVMQELPGQYKVDGDRVAVTAPSWGLVFTRKGATLEARYLGGPVVCTKVSDAISLVPVQGVWTLNYRRIVTQEGTPQVYDTRSLPTCSASVRRACGSPLYLVLDTTNQGQYSYATVPPSDPSYTPLARGSARVARDSLILGGAHPATYSLQVSSPRMHLTRHYKLGTVGALSFGFRSLPPGDSVEVTGEWWFQRR